MNEIVRFPPRPRIADRDRMRPIADAHLASINPNRLNYVAFLRARGEMLQAWQTLVEYDEIATDDLVGEAQSTGTAVVGILGLLRPRTCNQNDQPPTGAA